MLPEMDDSILLNFTEDQMQWYDDKESDFTLKDGKDKTITISFKLDDDIRLAELIVDLLEDHKKRHEFADKANAFILKE